MKDEAMTDLFATAVDISMLVGSGSAIVGTADIGGAFITGAGCLMLLTVGLRLTTWSDGRERRPVR